jgi:hypothetical protein
MGELIEFQLFYRPRITKIYFKGRYFMLRVCDKNVSKIEISVFSTTTSNVTMTTLR